MLKKLVKKIVMGHKADCESHLAFLKRGATVGDNVRILLLRRRTLMTRHSISFILDRM